MKKEIYLVTSEDNNDLYPIRFIEKFYSKEKAIKEYKEQKKDGLENVKISKVISIKEL